MSKFGDPWWEEAGWHKILLSYSELGIIVGRKTFETTYILCV